MRSMPANWPGSALIRWLCWSVKVQGAQHAEERALGALAGVAQGPRDRIQDWEN